MGHKWVKLIRKNGLIVRNGLALYTVFQQEIVHAIVRKVSIIHLYYIIIITIIHLYSENAQKYKAVQNHGDHSISVKAAKKHQNVPF